MKKAQNNPVKISISEDDEEVITCTGEQPHEVLARFLTSVKQKYGLVG